MKVISIQQAKHSKFLDCKIPLYAIHRNSHPSMMPSLADHQKHLNIQTIAFDIVQPVSNENIIQMDGFTKCTSNYRKTYPLM